MKKEIPMQTIKDILSFVETKKTFKELEKFKYESKSFNAKLVNILVKTDYIYDERDYFIISPDGIVLLALIRKILEAFDVD